MTTKWKSPTFGFLVEYTAWSSLAEQSARRAVLYRPEFFRSKVSLWSSRHKQHSGSYCYAMYYERYWGTAPSRFEPPLERKGFIREGSVVGLEANVVDGTVAVYVDGRRLGGRWEDKLVTGQDTAPIPKWPYGRFRWCGVVTYGAELRFSGPEIPYGWPSDRPHPSYLVPHGIFRR